MSMVMPGSLSKLKLFEDKLPLFNRFQIENQIESAFAREVTLPSGGAIVIDHTEALISIDVNSARATRGADIEETAKMTNLEAADEIARQLRIRDLGGLIVIDFIDMLQNKNQREVENRLRNAVYDDRARVQIGRISRFGLLEMSRQRLRPSLEESSQIICPRCSGQGTIRDVESLSLAVLRLLEDEALKDNTGKILAKIPVECATYLLNEKRSKIDALEQRREVNIVVIPDPRLETPHYHIERVRDNDTHRHESNYKKSYELTTEETPVDLVATAGKSAVKPEIAAVQRIAPSGPRPAEQAVARPAPQGPGLFVRLFRALFGSGEEASESDGKSPKEQDSRQARGGNRSRRGGKNRGGQKSRQRDNNKAQAAEARASDAPARAGDSADRESSSEGQESRRSSGGRSGRSRGGRSGGRGGRGGGRQQDKAAADKAAATETESSASADDSATQEQPARKQESRRKSGSRGGAGRKRPKRDATAEETARGADGGSSPAAGDDRSAPGARESAPESKAAATGSRETAPDGKASAPRGEDQSAQPPTATDRQDQPARGNGQPAGSAEEAKPAAATAPRADDNPDSKPRGDAGAKPAPSEATLAGQD